MISTATGSPLLLVISGEVRKVGVESDFHEKAESVQCTFMRDIDTNVQKMLVRLKTSREIY